MDANVHGGATSREANQGGNVVMQTLEEELYRASLSKARELLRTFMEDEPSVMYILRNLNPYVYEQVVNGGIEND